MAVYALAARLSKDVADSLIDRYGRFERKDIDEAAENARKTVDQSLKLRKEAESLGIVYR